MKIPKNEGNWSKRMPSDPIPPSVSDDEPRISEGLARDPSEPASNLGKETVGNPDVSEDDDEKKSLEHIVEEGVEGAQDDQMRGAQAHREQ
jgi:hypothetical protein